MFDISVSDYVDEIKAILCTLFINALVLDEYLNEKSVVQVNVVFLY